MNQEQFYLQLQYQVEHEAEITIQKMVEIEKPEETQREKIIRKIEQMETEIRTAQYDESLGNLTPKRKDQLKEKIKKLQKEVENVYNKNT